MKKCKIAICAKEKEYVQKLAEYINRSKEELIAVSFTEFETFSNRKENYDLILGEIDFKSLCKEEESFVLLGENSSENFDQEEEWIYPYQDARNIVEQIRKILHLDLQDQKKQNPKKEGEEGGMPIYGVYSPIGKSGKTTLALALAKTEHGFYVGMENYGSFLKEDDNFNELMYFISIQSDQAVKSIPLRWKKQYGVDVLATSIMEQDGKAIEKEQWSWFFEQMKTQNYASCMVMDIGVGVLEDISVLELFDHVFVPIGDQETDQYKLDNFKEHLRRSKTGEEQIHFVKVRKGTYGNVLPPDWNIRIRESQTIHFLAD